MAEEIAKGISEAGGEVKLVNAKSLDFVSVRDDVERAKGLLFGSPTFNGDAVKPIWDVISMLFAVETKGKKGAAFGSYGWGGEAVRLIEDRLQGLKITVPESGPRVNFTPSSEDLAKCKEFGIKFARSL